MANEMILMLNDDGVGHVYDETYDIVIHCESAEEQKEVEKRLMEMSWVPCSERLPESGRYLVSCSLSVFSPQVLNYDENNGEWFYDGCKSMDVEIPTINAWMPLPEPWRGEEHEQT